MRDYCNPEDVYIYIYKKNNNKKWNIKNQDE